MKYYNNNEAGKYSSAWYFLDSKGQEITKSRQGPVSCFSAITYYAIPKNVAKIVVFRELINIPYSKEIIQKWIDELNEFGIPMFNFFDKRIS